MQEHGGRHDDQLTERRSPVLVGIGDVTQRDDPDVDPAAMLGATGLMEVAVRAALADGGVDPSVLGASRVLVAVPEGSWTAFDPARVIAERVGLGPVVTLMAEVGVSQQQVIADGCEAIAIGEFDAVIIVGGEARRRDQRAQTAGIELSEPSAASTRGPDRRLAPDPGWIHDIELVRNLVTPAVAYAVIDSARRSALGASDTQRRRELGEMYADLSAVACRTASSWERERFTPEEIVEPSGSNRMISSPYTKRLCSQWNVDQAAAMLLTSTTLATTWQIACDLWVYPLASAVSNHSVPVVQRSDLGSSPGAEAMARELCGWVGIEADAIGPVDLYSCFPVAVDVLAAAFGLGDRRERSIVGGMAFGGGPLNNFALQAMAELVRLLRETPGDIGLCTSVSGFLTKVGGSLWSTNPSVEFSHIDVSEEVSTRSGILPVEGDWIGPATIAGWTVEHLRGQPHRCVVVLDTPSGGRTIASTGDSAVCRRMIVGDWLGTDVEVHPDGSFTTG